MSWPRDAAGSGSTDPTARLLSSGVAWGSVGPLAEAEGGCSGPAADGAAAEAGAGGSGNGRRKPRRNFGLRRAEIFLHDGQALESRLQPGPGIVAGGRQAEHQHRGDNEIFRVAFFAPGAGAASSSSGENALEAEAALDRAEDFGDRVRRRICGLHLFCSCFCSPAPRRPESWAGAAWSHRDLGPAPEFPWPAPRRSRHFGPRRVREPRVRPPSAGVASRRFSEAGDGSDGSMAGESPLVFG